MASKTSKRIAYALYAVIFVICALPSIKAGDVTHKALTILTQTGTLLFSVLLFSELYQERVGAFFGTLLYMTFPYRLYLSYEKLDSRKAFCFMLLPVIVWAVVKYLQAVTDAKIDSKTVETVTDKPAATHKTRSLLYLFFLAIALTACAYADNILFLIILGFLVLSALVIRKPMLLLSALGSAILSIPKLIDLFLYLFTSRYDDFGFSLSGITAKGYYVGQLFSSFTYAEGHPGLGLGLLLSIAVLIWLLFVEGDYQLPKFQILFSVYAGLLLFMSLRIFPWDMVQRVGTWSLKLVPFFESPALFFGLAGFCLCIPAGAAMSQISGHKNKAIAVGVSLFAIAFCIVATLYRFMG